jgi:hypothetical protein
MPGKNIKNKPNNNSEEKKRNKAALEQREMQDAVQALKDVYIRNVFDAIRLYPRFRKNIVIKVCRILWQDNPRRIADLDKDFPPK